MTKWPEQKVGVIIVAKFLRILGVMSRIQLLVLLQVHSKITV